jgi:hypothetical protein
MHAFLVAIRHSRREDAPVSDVPTGRKKIVEELEVSELQIMNPLITAETASVVKFNGIRQISLALECAVSSQYQGLLPTK